MLFMSRLSRWWRDAGRHIFHFHDGVRWRRLDPMTVGVRLEQLCPEYPDRLALIGKNPSTVPVGPTRDDLKARQMEAAQELVTAARAVFDLKPLSDDGGVTSGEAIGVLTQYFLFMEDLATEASVFTDSPKQA